MRAFAIAASLALLGVVGAAPAARADEKVLTAAMTAAEETPPGPDGATGAATITIDESQDTLCYDVSWSEEVGTPTAGHIHKGQKGLAGPVVVNFQLPDKPKDCLQVEKGVLQDILADPGGHYVNVHNNMYPAGAVRGQLQAG
jgi:hypothetical protein